MNRDLPRTLLSIDRFAQIIGLDPRHFNQVITVSKPAATCSKVWKQYAWQEAGQISRYDVALAIQQTEALFAQYLGYKLLPTWEYAERKLTPQPANPELSYSDNYDPRGHYLAVQTDWGHFVEGGVETKSLIKAGVAITYSDLDFDLYDETGTTANFATVDANGNAITDGGEIAIFYPGESGADEWEIRPLRSVSIVGGIATVKMWKHQLVLPALTEALAPEAVNGDDNTKFLLTVDVYRRYNDPTTQVTLIWNPNIMNCGCTTESTECCPVCGQTTQTGCLMPKDYPMSFLMYRPAEYANGEWSTLCLACGRNPDQLLLYYRAGLQDKKRTYPMLEMNQQWERTVAYYALSVLDRDICDCNPMGALADKWKMDLSEKGNFQIGSNVLENPLGTTRAAVMAWNMIKEPGRRLASPVKY